MNLQKTIKTNDFSREDSRLKILKKRSEYLKKNPQAFKGNRKERTEYLAELQEIKPELTKFQKEYLVGLNLGDLSVEFNHNARTARIKMQQKATREGWLEHIREIFLEYMPNDSEFKAPSDTRKTMRELQSLKCSTFYDFFKPLFYNDKRKSITDGVLEYISPVSVAALFCGDGSKADFTPNEGKGITFHTQGFSEFENTKIAEKISSELGLDAKAKADGTKSGQWRIDVSGKSYETFCEKVGPWVHETFHYRVPSGRVSDSRYGDMTYEKRASLLGSALSNLEKTIVNY